MEKIVKENNFTLVQDTLYQKNLQDLIHLIGHPHLTVVVVTHSLMHSVVHPFTLGGYAFVPHQSLRREDIVPLLTALGLASTNKWFLRLQTKMTVTPYLFDTLVHFMKEVLLPREEISCKFPRKFQEISFENKKR
jgi:hypothetical protein